MSTPQITQHDTALLIIDIQQNLLPHIDNHTHLLDRASVLTQGSVLLDLPIIVTEQYPKGIGPTVKPISSLLPNNTPIIEKIAFSAANDSLLAQLTQLQKSTILICGIEAHICVLQTCLDLISAGFTVALACDAIGSRRPIDRDIAIQRMTTAGVIPTTAESVLFEMLQYAGTDLFKKLLKIVK